jgi:hypothetical protein
MDALEKMVEQGFTLRSFPAYERHLGIEKYGCAALLEPTLEGGWRRFGSAGHLLNDQIALLIERGGRRYFVHKADQVPAEGERLAKFQRFLKELDAALAAK